jgi:hypothetical protein
VVDLLESEVLSVDPPEISIVGDDGSMIEVRISQFTEAKIPSPPAI